MPTAITRVQTTAEMRQFCQFPHELYRGCPQYVPLLNREMRKFLSPGSNPFFEHATAAYFLARQNGRPVGRIAAIVNRRHLELYQDATGFFGFFDAVDDRGVARALLGAAAAFLHGHGLETMVGPENLSTNDSVGILTHGFDDPPVVMMPYNYPYYRALLEGQGLSPCMTLAAFPLDAQMVLQKIGTAAAHLESRLHRAGIVLRDIDFHKFEKEAAQLRRAYNAANAANWGFVPLTPAEFQHTAADMRQLVEPWNVQLAEKNGAIVGFLVSLPDINQVLIRIREGRLFPFGWRHLLGFRKKISRVRVLILGVLPAFRGLGIDVCLYARIARFTAAHGIPGGEAGYVLENNDSMRRMLQRLGGTASKSYLLLKGKVADLA